MDGAQQCFAPLHVNGYSSSSFLRDSPPHVPLLSLSNNNWDSFLLTADIQRFEISETLRNHFHGWGLTTNVHCPTYINRILCLLVSFIHLPATCMHVVAWWLCGGCAFTRNHSSQPVVGTGFSMRNLLIIN